MLEKTSGAIFGAPLVGYLTSNMIQMKDDNRFASQEELSCEAHALAWNLFGLSSLFRILCAAFGIGMVFTTDNDHTTSANKALFAVHYKTETRC